MFGKKRELNLKAFHEENKKEEPFVIPQFKEDQVGLRVKRDTFQRTQALSSMTGSATKDVTIVDAKDRGQDVDLVYDGYRVNKKLTPESEVEKYGKRFHEFPSIDSREEYPHYEKPEEVKEEKVEKLNLFGVTSLEDAIEDKKDTKLSNAPIFEQNEETDIAYRKPLKETVKVSDFEEPKKAPEFIYDKEEPVAPKFINREIPDDVPSSIISRGPRRKEYDPLSRDQQYQQMASKEEENPMFTATFDFPTEEESAPSIKQEPKVEYEHEEIEDNSITFENFHGADAPKVFEAPEVVREQEYEAPKAPVIEKSRYEHYKFPPLSLLNPVTKGNDNNEVEMQEKVDIINETLKNFDIEGTVDKYTCGPAVTRFEIKLQSGVKVQKITNISENIKMELAAKTIRIEAPIPGKTNVGIEVPNRQIRSVSFAEIVDREEFKTSHKPLDVAMGLDIDGNPVYSNIAKWPHGLIAGGTGSGKSVSMNTILVSLLLRRTPDELKLILIDPKKVELISYSDIPHLVTPVINDATMASESLKWACEEMDKRYDLFTSVRGSRDIETYNERIASDPTKKKLPYIVIVIDELADLLMTCGKDVEESIQRITQKARAAGIHLLVATQRPTADIISGNIKANIQTRVAFRVAQTIDSMTILDQPGAEDLLGRGDMLLKEQDIPVRVQGAYITSDEIDRVCDYLVNNYGPDYFFTHEELQKIIQVNSGGGAAGVTQEDENLAYQLACFVVERQTCSINSIQKNFNLGFNRAQALVEYLEERGVVSGRRGTTGRQVLMTQEEVDASFERN